MFSYQAKRHKVATNEKDPQCVFVVHNNNEVLSCF